MKEFELIDHLTRSLHTNSSLLSGPGDDCAVLDLGMPDRVVLFKTDAVVQDVHFKMSDTPEQVGHKALGRCLSDIAAMAGTPTAALVTLALPSKFDPAYLERLYLGMNRLAERYDIAIAGGETTTNPERLLISISLLGWTARGRQVLRSAAKPSDAIFVTGELGGSLSGKHLQFEPRLTEARWLAQTFAIHAMIDLSDGLAGDLPHILKASGVGAELLAAAVPISSAARRAAKSSISAKTPLLAALTDGEDFELLFTTSSSDAVKLLDAWKAQFPEIRLSCIGKVTSSEGVTIRDKHGARALTVHGYEHFAQPR
jgi:thiamine-monophosphate kinase